MKKALAVIGILFLLTLDWVALDDITTGNEPNYFAEYLILLVSLLIFGFIAIKFVPKILFKK